MPWVSLPGQHRSEVVSDHPCSSVLWWREEALGTGTDLSPTQGLEGSTTSTSRSHWCPSPGGKETTGELEIAPWVSRDQDTPPQDL